MSEDQMVNLSDDAAVMSSGACAVSLVPALDDVTDDTGPPLSPVLDELTGIAPEEAHEADPDDHQGRSGPSRFQQAGLLAAMFGISLLLFVGYVYAFSPLQEHRSQRALLNDFTTAARARILLGHHLSPGEPAAVLTIPAIGLTDVVVEGTSATDLLKGPGLMPGTARPGSLGNAVIAGHRSIDGSPFAHLAALKPGDKIEVVTAQGAYTYRVITGGRSAPGRQDPISPNRHPRLTLVTSGGSSATSGRAYVVAALKTTPNTLAVPRHPPSLVERGLGGDPAAVVPSIVWGLAMVAGMAVSSIAYWRFRQHLRTVYLLSMPVVLALAFVWYGNVIRLLPGTS